MRAWRLDRMVRRVSWRLLTGLMAAVCVMSACPYAAHAEKVEPTVLTGESQVDTATVARLMEQGFPESYARALLPLVRLHPSWRFEPILVPESWGEVLQLEANDEPERNLITATAAYAAYRHEDNATLYDNGFYQASIAAVAYFMDPRNFFGEADIFQFYCLSAGEPSDDLRTTVDAVLRDTFMAGALPGEDKSYTDAFLDTAEHSGVSAIYLAVKARQEQGNDGSATVTGACGTLLSRLAQQNGGGADEASALLVYDALYNLYNVGASGNGGYEILLSAMQRAERGTPELVQAWDGNAAWDTVEKSMLGGALMMKSQYIDNGQDTLYLQKFNVSPDSSRRFWGQYMQNVAGALSEGRSLFRAFEAADCLDAPLQFRIPVYRQLPEQPCADPAMGECAYTARAATTYGGTVQWAWGEQPPTEMVCPATYFAAPDRGEELTASGTLQLWGAEEQTLLPESLQWCLLTTGHEVTVAWQPLEMTVDEAQESVSFSLSLPALKELLPDVEVGDQVLLLLRARLADGAGQRFRTVTVAQVAITATDRIVPPVILVLQTEQQVLAVHEVAAEQSFALSEALVSGVARAAHTVMIGWQVTFSDGSEALYPPDGSVVLQGVQIRATAQFVTMKQLPGAALQLRPNDVRLRFTGAIARESVQRLDRLVPGDWSVGIQLTADGSDYFCEATQRTRSAGGSYEQFDGLTRALGLMEYRTDFEARTYLRIAYADGQTRTFTTQLLPLWNRRSAYEVACGMLRDEQHEYGEEMRELARQIVWQR